MARKECRLYWNHFDLWPQILSVFRILGFLMIRHPLNQEKGRLPNSQQKYEGMLVKHK